MLPIKGTSNYERAGRDPHLQSAGGAAEPDLIDKEELRRRLNLPSIRMVEELMRKRKIPYLRLGHRTVRFSWQKVLLAISRFERRAAGE